MKKAAELIGDLIRMQFAILESAAPAPVKATGLTAVRDAIEVGKSSHPARIKLKVLGLGRQAAQAALRGELETVRRIHAEIKEFDV